MQSITLMYAAPIPVGHRVQIRWYQVPVKGLLSASENRCKDFEPITRDLESGIEYATDFALGSPGVKSRNQPVALGATPVAGSFLVAGLTGKVLACRVVTVRGFSHYDVQTHLDIEPTA